MTQPVVSILCTVYNKAPWLEQTLASFVAQETNFPVEILIVDDASTDSSLDIIQAFQAKYPDNVLIFSNPVNQGIAKTWVELCAKASGKYIARCDGDDFWLDTHKLQKQVDLLEANPDSAWSNSDFDIYDESGQFVSAAGFESGTIPLADSYEKMLATRGFTMASTWLVERELMLAVNQCLDLSTADDTFNLQLELFQRTKLSYLPEATVAYVVNTGSDSRPRSYTEQKARFEKLLETQKAYVRRYPDRISEALVDLLLERANAFEWELSQAAAGLAGIGFESVTVFFSDESSGFRPEQSQSFALKATASLEIALPENCSRVRIDLSERPSFYDRVEVRLSDGSLLPPSWSNGQAFGEGYLFKDPDPQLIYDLPQEKQGDKLILNYKMSQIDQVEAADYLVKTLMDRLLSNQEELEQVRENYQRLELENTMIKNSRRWKITTKVIDLFRRKK